MPKAKSSSSRANARSSKKSAGKKGLLAKLNLTSKRNQFIAVILLVAVMGAGWFTYKSFAATKPVQSWLWSANQLSPLVQPGCKAQKIDDSAKGSNYAILVSPCPKGAGNTKITKNVAPSGARDYFLYEACVFARGTGQITVVNSQRKSSRFNLDPGKYVNYCTPYTGIVTGSVGPSTEVIINRNSTAYISSLSLHKHINNTPDNCTGGKNC